MPETSTAAGDLDGLDLADLDLSGLEVHAVRDAVALPETGASASFSLVWRIVTSSSCAAQ